MKYVTYSPEIAQMGFDKEKLVRETSLKTNFVNKPEKAFWGSPYRCSYSWKKWCRSEDFETENIKPEYKFIWTLKPGSKVLKIKKLKDLLKVPTITINKYDLFTEEIIDFKELSKEYDAVLMDTTNYYFGHMWMSTERIHEITGLPEDQCERIHKTEVLFNGWDCDSIVVLNPSKIIFHGRRK